MTNNHKRIVRLVVRFDNRFAELERAHDEGAELDAGFDGGEFSGPAHDIALCREADALARRLGFDSACLVDRIACLLGVRTSFRVLQFDIF